PARAAPRRRPRGRSPPRRGSRAVTAPRVSVLLAVHDGAPWVKDAVASVLAQTLADLELVVVDDGSADATPALLAGIADRRLRVERRPRAGLTRALNLALGLARAPIVARLDADDVALPERLARQVAFVVRRLLPGRVSVARDADRLRAEARARWRAVRAGAYPPWCLVFVARPLLALAVPGPWRRALRRSRG